MKDQIPPARLTSSVRAPIRHRERDALLGRGLYSTLKWVRRESAGAFSSCAGRSALSGPMPGDTLRAGSLGLRGGSERSRATTSSSALTLCDRVAQGGCAERLRSLAALPLDLDHRHHMPGVLGGAR